MSDITLTCVECQGTFVHNEEEQRFFAEHSYVTPKRCLACRRKNKANRCRGQQDEVHPVVTVLSNGNKKIACIECGYEFLHDARAQIFFAEHNYQDPKRCPKCRHKNKDQQTTSYNEVWSHTDERSNRWDKDDD